VLILQQKKRPRRAFAATLLTLTESGKEVGRDSALSNTLTVHIEETVEPTFPVSWWGDNALYLGSVDFNGNGSLLLGISGHLGGLILHDVQTGIQGFWLADGERGH
jgi:hypothetical protein